MLCVGSLQTKTLPDSTRFSCGQTNGVWSLFFGAIGTAITADVFADHSSNENEQDRKRYLQLFFESAVVFACLADLIATIKLLGAEDDER